jgi:hydroxymethylbilane synthase
MGKLITIGSRGSDLALWQANHVKAELESLGHEVKIQIITTQGDAIQDLSFDKLEGKGFFTKEIEEQLLDGKIDLAVHSHKDLETNPPPGLIIAAVSEREDPSELVLIRKESVDSEENFGIKKNAIVGTSSARRKSQLLAYREDIEIKDIRGNVPTRIDKLRNGDFDAIMLAAAGVRRLKLDVSDLEVRVLDPTQFVPSPAQGVLALQIREDDTELAEILSKLNNQEVAKQIAVERGILNRLEGGCQLPLGAYCTFENDQYQVWVSFAQAWNELPIQATYEADDTDHLDVIIVEDLLQEING